MQFTEKENYLTFEGILSPKLEYYLQLTALRTGVKTLRTLFQQVLSCVPNAEHGVVSLTLHI